MSNKIVVFPLADAIIISKQDLRYIRDSIEGVKKLVTEHRSSEPTGTSAKEYLKACKIIDQIDQEIGDIELPEE